MSGEQAAAPPKRGDVVRDRDGREWRVLFVRTESGEQMVNRVRVGSLAESVIFGDPPRLALDVGSPKPQERPALDRKAGSPETPRIRNRPAILDAQAPTRNTGKSSLSATAKRDA